MTEVLEEHLNTIAGLRSLKSTTMQGAAMITAEFELERDIDEAAQDVRDKVGRARYELPREVPPPVINKINMSSRPIVWLPLNSNRSQVETTEFIKYTVKPYLETISGVAGTEIFGKRERAIRIWIDGEALRARGLGVLDVVGALQREHIDVPAGRLESHALEYSLKTEAEFKSIEDLASLIVAQVGGAPVRLGDVARVEDGAEDERFLARFNGAPGAGIGILKQSLANTVEIADRTHDQVDELRKFLPEGLTFPERDQVIDFSSAIRESVAETQFALVLGAFLATLTVLAFLRRVRPTLVVGDLDPALARRLLRGDVDLRVHDQHHDAAGAGAGGRRGDRRRHHRAREHRAPARGGRVAARGGVEGREPDRLRRDRRHALDRRRVPARRVRARHRGQLPEGVRPDGRGVGDLLAVRRADADSDAGRADARDRGAPERRRVPPARAPVRAPRSGLRARARLGARPPRDRALDRRRVVRRRRSSSARSWARSSSRPRTRAACS